MTLRSSHIHEANTSKQNRNELDKRRNLESWSLIFAQQLLLQDLVLPRGLKQIQIANFSSFNLKRKFDNLLFKSFPQGYPVEVIKHASIINENLWFKFRLKKTSIQWKIRKN